MQKRKPFNIQLIDTNKSRLAGLLPVQSMDIYDVENDFHPQGLYSSQIFGKPGEKTRMSRHGYIDMRTEVLHPKIFMELSKLKNLYSGILSGTAYATWDAKEKDFVKSDILDGKTGYSFFMEYFPQMKFPRNESAVRDLRIDLIEKYRTSCLYRYLIVIPAGLREIEVEPDGRITEDEINNLYRKIMRVANTIAVRSSNLNDPSLDTARWALQKAFNEIYEYLNEWLEGKRGFIYSKWGTRAVHYGTRNVITAMDPAPAKLGETHAYSVNDTMAGLFQYMKGILDLTIHGVKTGPMARVLDALPGNIPVIDPKTLKTVYIEPSNYVKERWATIDGLEGLINGFDQLEVRHRPVVLDGYYPALIYRDEKYFKVLHDIDEVPEGWDRSNVKPITWAEMYYISVFKFLPRTVGFVTRYPVTGMGSIYPTNIYLKTTVEGESLYELDSGWVHESSEMGLFPEMPIAGDPFFDSMSVHPSKEPGLGADHDGDMTSLPILYSDDAVKEVKEYLNSPNAYINPQGGLNYGINNHVASLVLHNFTSGV